MTTSELKPILMAAHERDRRLSFISMGLLFIVTIVVMGFFFSLTSFENSTNNYPFYAVSALIVGYIIYGIYKIRKLNNRETEIDEFLAKIDAGKVASMVQDKIEHKIILPLGKINIKLCPVVYCMVVFDNDFKGYDLPFYTDLLPDIKTMLSGVDFAKVEAAKRELYADSPIGEKGADGKDTVADYSNEVSVIKSIPEFRQYIASDLSETLTRLESGRKTNMNFTFIIGALVGVAVLGYMGYTMYANMGAASEEGYTGAVSLSTYLPIIVLFAAIYIGYFLFIRPKQMKALAATGTPNQGQGGNGQNFKIELMDKIIHFASPNAQYAMHGHIKLDEFLDSGLFDRSTDYTVSGSDLIIGRHSGVPYQFSDLTVEVNKRIKKEKEAPTYAFCGQFFVAKFNKKFSSPVYITPKRGVKGFFFDNSASEYTNFNGDKVELEDPEFMKMFNVYSADPIESRYILSPSLMERIKELAIRTQGQFYIAFSNNKIVVANNSEKDNFEVGMFTSLTKDDNKVMIDFYQDLCDQFAIIDELKLNVKIWG